MASIYEIEYRYGDEYKAGEPTHNALVCVYDSSKVGAGETIHYALEKANEDGDWAGLDKLLGKLFDLKDEDICFYYDISDIEDGATIRALALVPELQKSFDIVIEDICVERGSSE